LKRLLINFAGLGDLVILIPLMRKLAEKAELDLLTRPFGSPIFEDQSCIAETFVLSQPNRGKSGLSRLFLGRHRARLAEKLKKRKYDEIIVFSGESNVIIHWINSWRDRAVCKVLDYPAKHPDRVKMALESQGFSLDEYDPLPRLEIPEAEIKAAKNKFLLLGERVVAIQAGCGLVSERGRRQFNVRGLTARQWGLIITHILAKVDADAVVFHGTLNESKFVKPIIKYIPERLHSKLHDWTGKVPVKELRSFYTAHYALISIDTGPAHLAAAVGCPVLAFFGPEDPQVYLMKGPGPFEMVVGDAPCQFCDGTPLFKDCKDNICLNRLTEEQLVEGWERLKKRLIN
jgi:ADP-heptose:LPS heptosyltransferase